METPEQQEARACRQVSWNAVIKTSLYMGAFLFIFSGGTPWTSGGVANGILGRAVPGMPWILVAIGHFVACFVCIAIIAHIIYPLRAWWAGVIVGGAVSLALYGVNYVFFASHDRGDLRAFGAHLILGLFGSAIYKAMSVPPPLQDPGEGPLNRDTAPAVGKHS